MPCPTHLIARAFLVLALAGAGLPSAAQSADPAILPAEDTAPVDVPSGQPVTLIDIILNEPGPAGNTMRFRFLAPEIAPDASITFDTAVIDMAALCDSYALPRATEATPVPDQIIISLADRVVPFGQADPEAIQYFEAYRIEDGACTWEMF
ncbi:MAG: DUF6497 family protein [Pseudomonadota bacterium]